MIIPLLYKCDECGVTWRTQPDGEPFTRCTYWYGGCDGDPTIANVLPIGQIS